MVVIDDNHFPMLADWPSQRVTWADLMFIESEIVIGTMLELMRSYSAPSFPVHDSIIVRKSDTELAFDILSQQFLQKRELAQNSRLNDAKISVIKIAI